MSLLQPAVPTGLIILFLKRRSFQPPGVKTARLNVSKYTISANQVARSPRKHSSRASPTATKNSTSAISIAKNSWSKSPEHQLCFIHPTIAEKYHLLPATTAKMSTTLHLLECQLVVTASVDRSCILCQSKSLSGQFNSWL